MPRPFIPSSTGIFISGTAANYAALPAAAIHTGELWFVENGSGGLLSVVGKYKYPKGIYSPNSSVVWEIIPVNVQVAEDSLTLLNITNWAEYIGFSFDIHIGDILRYNNITYKNLTGAQISTAPDTDETNWEALFLDHVITVAKSGGDYTSLKDALDSISVSGPNDKWTIQVAPGNYVEDNPIQMKTYVSCHSIGRTSARISAGNADEHLFIMENVSSLTGFSFEGVSGAGKYAAVQDVAGETLINDCVITDCENGILLDHVNAGMNIIN